MNNLATGMAALVASGYRVYSGRQVEAAWMKPVFLQMEAAMLKNNRVVQMDYSDKGYLYQVMVCLAMDLEAREASLESRDESAMERNGRSGAVYRFACATR